MKTIALLYDFDNTLCINDSTNYALIPACNTTSEKFFKDLNGFAVDNNMDMILSFLYGTIIKSKENNLPITRNQFKSYGKKLIFFPGVETWFKRINKFANENGANIEHYIISSGIKEIIEGNAISKEFKQIFASEYLYDSNGNACWPKLVVNYTGKTQFLFRVNKQVLDVSNDKDVNRYTPPSERPIPFENMIYFGDGFTDVPCMKLLKIKGGTSIAVFQENQEDLCQQLALHGRINAYYKADYSENSSLDIGIKAQIKRIITREE